MTARTAPPSASWADQFEAFGVFHLIVVLSCAALVVATCVLGARARRKGREPAIRAVWIGWIVVTQAFAVVWYMLPANYDPLVSWPIHLCDLAAWIAPAALLTKWVWLRAVLYFWAIGLSTQAYVTPVLSEGYTHLEFWFFWVGHTQIVGSAIYDVWVLRFRPTIAHFGIAFLTGLGYVGAMMGVNEINGANYGYVGRSLPATRTILNELPSGWIPRVLSLMAIAALAQALAWVPWAVARRVRPRSNADDDARPG